MKYIDPRLHTGLNELYFSMLIKSEIFSLFQGFLKKILYKEMIFITIYFIYEKLAKKTFFSLHI